MKTPIFILLGAAALIGCARYDEDHRRHSMGMESTGSMEGYSASTNTVINEAAGAQTPATTSDNQDSSNSSDKPSGSKSGTEPNSNQNSANPSPATPEKSETGDSNTKN